MQTTYCNVNSQSLISYDIIYTHWRFQIWNSAYVCTQGHKAVKLACCMWSFPIGQFVMYYWWDLICYWVFCNNNPQTAALWGNITPSLPTTATLWGNIKPLDIVTALNGQPETVWHLSHCVGVCLYAWEVGEGLGRYWQATLNWHAVPVLVVRPSNYYTHPTTCVHDTIPHIYILFLSWPIQHPS